MKKFRFLIAIGMIIISLIVIQQYTKATRFIQAVNSLSNSNGITVSLQSDINRQLLDQVLGNSKTPIFIQENGQNKDRIVSWNDRVFLLGIVLERDDQIDLPAIAILQSVNHVDLGGLGITKEVVEAIIKIDSVKTLSINVETGNMNHLGLGWIASLQDLESLAIIGNVNGFVFQSLELGSRVNEITLARTDIEVPEISKLLTKYKSIKLVHFIGSFNATKSEIQVLRESWPKVDFIID